MGQTKTWLKNAMSKNIDPDKSLTKFQLKWESVIREWSLRWGDKVSGWWIDGCYPCFVENMYRREESPNFKSFAAAMRAGNPDSLVSWNPGVIYPPERLDENEDYTGGETQTPLDVSCTGKYENGSLFHFMCYAGVWWAGGPARFSSAELIEATKTDDGFRRSGHMGCPVQQRRNCH